MSMLAEKFVEAIAAEIQEVRRKSRAARFDVRDGRRLEDGGNAVTYSFEASASQRLKEDSAILLIMPDGERISGSVILHKGGEIRISLERDIGERLPEAQMMTDDTFLLEKMREAVVDVTAGDKEFSMRLAMASIGEERSAVGEVPAETKGLNDDQGRSIRVALGSEVSYLWGPPGTGKTATMSRLVTEMFRRNISVLIVSNANLAVDTLLERVCSDLDKEKLLVPGAVVRYGTPVRESMVRDFGTRIVPGQVFSAENPGFDDEMHHVERRIHELTRARQVTAAKSSALPEIDRRREALARAERALKLAEAEVVGYNQKIVKRELHIAAWKLKLSKAFNQELVELIKEAEFDIIDLEEGREEARPAVEAAKKEVEMARQRVADLVGAATGDAAAEWETIQAEMDVLGGKLRRGHERKAEYAKQLAQKARIVAATAYQAYLTTLKKDGFDAVVIDEASMLPLPLVWLASGLARKHVVIAGDFRQLPAVALSELPVVKDFYAKDVFAKAGIAAGADAGRLPPHAVALRVQYRMRKDICDLINKPFYNGILKTPEGQHEGPAERGVFAASTLSILDFKGLQPWGMRKATGSRLNPWQAVGLAAAGAVLRRTGEWSADAREFGVITAYAAQAEALNECLRELGGFSVWPAATIHKFQGSEKDTIVFEVADGRGLRLGGFFRGSADGIDQRLLNVAFSRARKRVVLVGNMEYLDREAVAGSSFSHILAVFRQKARKVDALAMLKQFGPEIGVAAEDAARGRGAIAAEIAAARNRVDIFLSGWRLKEMLALGAVLKGRLSGGLQGSLRIDPAADQAMVQEPRLRGLIQELALAGLHVEVAGFSGQEAGLLIDKKALWLLPAGGFGANADAGLFLRTELPQFGSRLVAALREGTIPWKDAAAARVA